MRRYILAFAVITLVALPAVVGAEQAIFRPLDGSTWDAAQMRELLEKKGVTEDAIVKQEPAQAPSLPALACPCMRPAAQ